MKKPPTFWGWLTVTPPMATVRNNAIACGANISATDTSQSVRTSRTRMALSALAVSSAGAREGSALAALSIARRCCCRVCGRLAGSERKICFTQASLYRARYRLSNLR
jgi:hypothetical protein